MSRGEQGRRDGVEEEMCERSGGIAGLTEGGLKCAER